jgi:hypothetical protein
MKNARWPTLCMERNGTGTQVCRTGTKLLVFFEDIERVTAMEFHADRAQNGAHRAGSSTLLADDFANILWRDTQFEDSAFVPADGLHLDGCRLIDQRLCDLTDQFCD